MTACTARADAEIPEAERYLDRRMSVRASGLMPDTYVGAGYDYGPLRIYGGHLLGQALAAGFATVAPPKLAHSLHAHFLRSGQPDEPIAYSVERLRDGRNYSTRLVRAAQGDHTLLVMTASFKLDEPGDHHQPPMPEVRSAPSLRRRQRASGRAPLALPFAGTCGVELVPVDHWHPLAPPAGRPALALWMRADVSPDADARGRQCALAYLSDGTLMFNALRPHGTAFQTHRSTSLDHALWFHAPADPSDWLLFDQSGPAAADSRGLNQGTIFDAQGRLLATAVQEAMMRRN